MNGFESGACGVFKTIDSHKMGCYHSPTQGRGLSTDLSRVEMGNPNLETHKGGAQ